MNKPPGLNALLFAGTETGAMGSVETPPIMRLLRPTTFMIWLLVFCIEAQTIVSHRGGASWLILFLSTLLFVGVHVQFWYEESEQGRRFHRTMERMRGRIYEDDSTGLPNSRHFVFELRRQMMRSVRNGRGFALVLTDIGGWEKAKGQEDKILTAVSKVLRQSMGESDFVAHLQGAIFAAIVIDDRDRSSAEKADLMLSGIGSCIPLDLAGALYPVLSTTGYEGELEVRDFLRRAQRDLLNVRSHCMTSAAANVRRPAPSLAA
ncbi:MAG: diguanylate cyclase [Tepidiformaceae bacterium]